MYTHRTRRAWSVPSVRSALKVLCRHFSFAHRVDAHRACEAVKDALSVRRLSSVTTTTTRRASCVASPVAMSRSVRAKMRRGRSVRVVPVTCALMACVAMTEPLWLTHVPSVLYVPSWVPSRAAVVLGVPVKRRTMTWYGQFGQDAWAASVGGEGGRDGFFVELGAQDGARTSNTRALEERLGWRGVCVEADPLNFRVLRYHRPKCATVRAAVGAKRGTKVSFESGGLRGAAFGGFGGATGFARYRGRGAPSGTKIEMETMTLTDVLRSARAPREIDYLSLDVEGAEVDVLEGLDSNVYVVRAISVEHNFEETKRQRIFDLLSSRGYDRVATGDRASCDVDAETGRCASGDGWCACVDDFYILSTDRREMARV